MRQKPYGRDADICDCTESRSRRVNKVKVACLAERRGFVAGGLALKRKSLPARRGYPIVT